MSRFNQGNLVVTTHLRRLPELRPTGGNDPPVEPEATCVVPIECVYGDEVEA